MKPSQLSELHVRKYETLDWVKVIVTHLPTGEVAEAEGASRIDVKRRAYRALAKKLTERGL